ncbi:MAG: cytochrome c [Magnetococcales bacterium]|nr:cytochrome c [Magnetococcales bacterium]
MIRRSPWGAAGLVLTVTLPLTSGSALAGNPFAGEKIYARHCQSCHGPKGRGLMAGTPDFSWRGVATNGLGVPDGELVERILQGRRICPGFRGILAEGDVMNVITHLRTLR